MDRLYVRFGTVYFPGTHNQLDQLYKCKILSVVVHVALLVRDLFIEYGLRYRIILTFKSEDLRSLNMLNKVIQILQLGSL